ncbi:Hydroxylase/desaturase asaB [Pseudocercospora fuligena]|uniref:Hydroxylase/desaturase asaB n=1 Tax=Pseudocercospora fuligena TaxID=685502 RepID=A0A8H6R9W4_9PEZI|nr:Hydroxylase/desaturase asaB [Pseudocercospora fuligena]
MSLILTDQSFHGAMTTLKAYLPQEDAERLSKSRWAIINMWRPIKPVRRDPLAVCDWQTVRTETDLLPAMLTIPRREYGGKSTQQHERWSAAYNPNHQWYFASDMQPDEALLIKCFDSRKDGTARLAPHAALTIGEESEPARESVELRCLVFWEDQLLE